MKTDKKISQRKRYNEVVKLIEHTCRAKGWESELLENDEQDKKNLKYATFSIFQDSTGEEVTGVIHVTIDSGVKISAEPTSFHNYGIEPLFYAIQNELRTLTWLKSPSKKSTINEISGLAQLKLVLSRFHQVARQIEHRYSGRNTIAINDEYDVQDLLHSLLKIYFDDIRPEEYTPSYAGSSSRVDFLLKAENIVVEVKYANSKLTDKLIGEQLIIDTKRYQSHPDCKILVSFVYDPNGNLKNPHGLEKDLSGKNSDLNVIVVVNPPN